MIHKFKPIQPFFLFTLVVFKFIFKSLSQLFFACGLCLMLSACASFAKRPPEIAAHLADGKRAFQKGYYKAAMHILLPLACNGIAEAEYAVGYMHYYGYGVIEDKAVGFFWIERAAKQGYPPAIEAVKMIKINGD